MSRVRKRVCLEQGLRLEINFLARLGVIEFGNLTIRHRVSWKNASEEIAVGLVSAQLIGHSGWLEIRIDGASQSIEVISQGRYFGGAQRYFICPATGRKASVLWRPPGATEFRSRLGWGRSVAYITQIGSWVDRAHRGKEKIRNLLSGDRISNALVGDMPPKPKWMRTKTYRKYAELSQQYESALAQGPNGKSIMPHRKRASLETYSEHSAS
jgi:hypothetical protein